MDLEVKKDEQVTRWWKEKFQFSKNKSIYKWINSKLEEFPNFLSWRKLSNFSPKCQRWWTPFWTPFWTKARSISLGQVSIIISTIEARPIKFTLNICSLAPKLLFRNIFCSEYTRVHTCKLSYRIIKLSITIDLILSLLISLAECKSVHTD